MSSRKKQNFVLLLIAVGAFFSSFILHNLIQSRAENGSQKPLPFFAPPTEVRHFTLGHQDVLADLTWLRVLQDLDICEQKRLAEGAPRVGADRTSDCDRGWVYHMLDVIFESAPRWRTPAAIGPVVLSVVVDDINGASLLFKKATKNFPTDWPILFRAAAHFLYETNETMLAARLYDEAGKNGAPLWVHSLASKLYTEHGRYRVSRVVILDALRRTPPGPIHDKLKQRLKELDAAVLKASVTPEAVPKVEAQSSVPNTAAEKSDKNNQKPQ